MAGKDITELQSIDNITTGDLLLVRKSDIGVDKKISYQDLVKSIGNPGVEGFTAVADGDNKIMLSTANGAIITKYYVGMKISFVSPLKSTGVMQVSVGALPYKGLLAYKSTSSVAIEKDDYIEAVFIGDVFYQTNNSQYIYTNDYNVVLVEPNIAANYTDITLQSAYGTVKASYYKGMTVNFICSEDTVGLTRVKIDGLSQKDVLENSGDYIDLIYTPLYKGQIVRLIYDGQSFIKDRFSNTDPKIVPVVAPNPDNPEEPLVPSQNQSEFKVGTGQQFTNMQDALGAILKEYGEDGKKKGGQQKVILEITSDLALTDNPQDKNVISILDGSWITIKATNNIIRFMGTCPNGTIWHFDKAFAFEESIKIDVSNLSGSLSGSLSGINDQYSVLAARDIKLKNVEINAGSNNKVSTCITILGNGNANNLRLENCTLKGGKCGVLVNKGIANIINTKINGWISQGIYLNSNITATFTKCDFSKDGTTSTEDIYIRPLVTVNQINSKAKSNLAPSTSNQNGTYWVTGSQDIQGA